MNGGRAGSSRWVEYIPIARRPASAGGIARTPNTLQQRTESTECEPQPLLQQQPAAIRRRPNPNALNDEHDDAEGEHDDVGAMDFAAGDEEISSSDEDEDESDRSGADALAPVPASSPSSTEDGTTDLDPEPRPDLLMNLTERRSSDNAIDADETDDKADAAGSAIQPRIDADETDGNADAGDGEENSPDEEEAEEEETAQQDASDTDADGGGKTSDLNPLPQPTGPRAEYFMNLVNNTQTQLEFRDAILERLRSVTDPNEKKRLFQQWVAETYAFLRSRGGNAAIHEKDFFELIRAAMLVEGPGAVGFVIQTAKVLHTQWDNTFVANGGREPPSSPSMVMPPGYIPVNIHSHGEAGQTCCRGGRCMALSVNHGGQNDTRPVFSRMNLACARMTGEVEGYLKTCRACLFRALKLDPTVTYEDKEEFYDAMKRFADEHNLRLKRGHANKEKFLYANFSRWDYKSRCGARLDEDGRYRINAIPDDPT